MRLSGDEHWMAFVMHLRDVHGMTFIPLARLMNATNTSRFRMSRLRASLLKSPKYVCT